VDRAKLPKRAGKKAWPHGKGWNVTGQSFSSSSMPHDFSDFLDPATNISAGRESLQEPILDYIYATNYLS
jgi:hypothetical protein